MLVSVGLKNVFWAEVVMTIAYLINRCPSTALGMITPKEVWSGHPSDLDKLRVFGSVTYAHIRQEKIEPGALRCMFLGYLKGVKAYRLWFLEPGHRRCIISRDVVFNEVETTFKKTDDTSQNANISKEEKEQEGFHVKVEHLGNEVHNHGENPNEAQDAK